jgi:tellurite resistance protein TerC
MISDILNFFPLQWLIFSVIIVSLLFFDLNIFSKNDCELSIKKSLSLTAIYVTIGLLFGLVILYLYNPMSLESCAPKCHLTAAGYYWNAFIIEKVLSIDNIFVMSMIFGYLKIPRHYQHRVLFWGILGVIIMRGLMIFLGTTLIEHFNWILYLFGFFLIYTGFKMLPMKQENDDDDISKNKVFLLINKLLPTTTTLHGNKFFVQLKDEKTNKTKYFITPLMISLISIEIIDIVFALDSVPAVFSITLDPFIVYTSNIFAILGLRALYSALDAILDKLEYLKPTLAIILMFIGSKIFIPHIFDIEEIPMAISLGVTIGLLAFGTLYSLFKSRQNTKQQ